MTNAHINSIVPGAPQHDFRATYVAANVQVEHRSSVWLFTWTVRDRGARAAILDGASPSAIELRAVHPGGRAVLDAVQRGSAREPASLAAFRASLEPLGNTRARHVEDLW
jgi:hypothetical protein